MESSQLRMLFFGINRVKVPGSDGDLTVMPVPVETLLATQAI